MPLFKKLPKKLFVNNLRDTRENLQLMVQQVADYGNVTPETIEKIEAGEYTPSVVLALRIAELLSRPVAEVFPLPEPETVPPVKEERIEHEAARASSMVLLTAGLTALFAGFVLEFIPSTEIIGYTLFGVWAVLALAYLTAQSLVKGQRRWSLKVARQTSRKKAILTTIWTSALYGALMVWAP